MVAESCRCELSVAAVGVAALQLCVLTLQCFMADDVICEKLQTAPLPDLKIKEVNLQSSEIRLGTLAYMLIGPQITICSKVYN